MRMVIVHSGSDFYGASRSLLRFAERLLKQGHEIEIYVREKGPLIELLLEKGLKVKIEPTLKYFRRQEWSFWKNIRWVLGLPWSIVKIAFKINRFKPDLIYSNTGVILSGSLTAFILRVPHFWHLRDRFDDFPWLWKIYRYWILKSSRKVICVSEAVAKQFWDVQGWGNKVCVIHNGLPLREFQPSVVLRESYRKKLGLSAEDCAIGILGRIKQKRKGQEILLQAAALLKKTTHKNSFKVIIVGSAFPGNESHEIHLYDQIRELNLEQEVVWIGEVQDPRPIYDALDIVVLASAYPEPFAGVVLEAMAMGKAVVGTALGGTLEQLEHGISGMFVPPRDPEALALVLDLLIQDLSLRQRLGKKAQEQVKTKFCFEDFYLKLETLLREGIKKTR